MPHALQPARAAPGTRLALHRRVARAQARRRQRDMPPHTRSMWAAARRREAARRGSVITFIARAPRSTLFARGANAAQRLLPGQCRRRRGGCTRPPTHSAHAARACSSTHRRGKIHRAIFTRWSDGCRRTALHSLSPPSPDTHGARARVAIGSRATATYL